VTRVLVVHHDIDLADQEAEALRRAGYQVTECMGPIGAECPILKGIPCAYAEDADVLVYDAFVTGEPDGARTLIERIREIHPTVPLVLTASGMEPDWLDLAGAHRVTPLVGQPTAARLDAAIRQALADAAADGGDDAGTGTVAGA
jgi:CheY-like chemotaxis protein